MRAYDVDGDGDDDVIVTEAVSGASVMWMENSWQPRIVLSVHAVPAAAVGAFVNISVHIMEVNGIVTLACGGPNCVVVNGSNIGVSFVNNRNGTYTGITSMVMASVDWPWLPQVITAQLATVNGKTLMASITAVPGVLWQLATPYAGAVPALSLPIVSMICGSATHQCSLVQFKHQCLDCCRLRQHQHSVYGLIWLACSAWLCLAHRPTCK